MGQSIPGKGDFATLLNAGQFDISKVKKNSSSVVPGFKVEHFVSSYGRYLSIIIKDKEAVRLIFF